MPTVIRLSIEAIKLWAERRPAGYAEDVLASGVISNSADGVPQFVTLTEEAYERLREKYRGPRQSPPANAASIAPPQPPAPTHGPGTELKKLLKRVGITATPNCSCNARARKMDERGCDWCEENVDEIVGWLREEATKRKLPFLDVAGKILVRKAIKNARRKQGH